MSFNFVGGSPPTSSFLSSAASSPTATNSSDSPPLGNCKLPTIQEMLNNIGANSVNFMPNPLLQTAQLPLIPTLTFNPFLQSNAMITTEAIQQFLNIMTINSTNQFLSSLGTSSSQDGERQTKMRREMKKSISIDSSNNDEMIFDNNGDIIVPSSDKEGWCRNKKYIEKTENGFMCTVCRKVYGRYNSVSYHVTIYHRNPPIKCNLQNCQFTTREARYIHFHKYYRHGVPLPQNIDQGSRKCPHCRHVSKSPAMLEKHIRRHQIKEESAEGSDLLVIDPIARDRTRTLCEEPMEVETDESMETKPRSCTL